MTTQQTHSPADQQAMVEQFVDAFGGNATQAMLAIAVQYGIAVNYQDRATIEARLGRALIDGEWERLRPEMENYDEWLENSGAADSIDYWLGMVLEQADIDTDWDDDQDDEYRVYDDGLNYHRGRRIETVTTVGEAL